MIIKRFYFEQPSYLIEGVGINPDYRKVEDKFEERFFVRYRNRMIDSWSLSNLNGMGVALNLNQAFVIMTNEGPENRRVIIATDSEEKVDWAKSGLENLFDGNPKLNLRESK